jgi:hypothetical protein
MPPTAAIRLVMSALSSGLVISLLRIVVGREDEKS